MSGNGHSAALAVVPRLQSRKQPRGLERAPLVALRAFGVGRTRCAVYLRLTPGDLQAIENDLRHDGAGSVARWILEELKGPLAASRARLVDDQEREGRQLTLGLGV